MKTIINATRIKGIAMLLYPKPQGMPKYVQTRFHVRYAPASRITGLLRKYALVTANHIGLEPSTSLEASTQVHRKGSKQRYML